MGLEWMLGAVWAGGIPMATVWLCGIAPSQHSEISPLGGRVAWCETRSGGLRLRAGIGPDFALAKLSNATDNWLGKDGNSDRAPPAQNGLDLLMEIARSAAPGEAQLVALLGVTFWGSVLNLASQNNRKTFRFYNDPLVSNKQSRAGYNFVEVNQSNQSTTFLQIVYLPHTRHWAEPKADETTGEYRCRTAEHIASNPGLAVDKGGFILAM